MCRIFGKYDQNLVCKFIHIRHLENDYLYDNTFLRKQTWLDTKGENSKWWWVPECFYILKTGFRMIVYILLNRQGNLCEVVEIEFRVLVRIDTPMTCD